MTKTDWLKYLKYFLLFLALVMVLVSLWRQIYLDAGRPNLYIYQAKAFLEGHLDITPNVYQEVISRGRVSLDIDRDLHDIAIYRGRLYLPFPPFPALVLMPLVAMVKMNSTLVMLVSLILTGLNVVLLIKILQKLKMENKSIPWLVAAFFLGTAYLLSLLMSSEVYYFAHLVAVASMFLAINEALGKGRGLLVGLFLGMAFLSRQLSVFAVFFLGMVLWNSSFFNTRKERINNILKFLIPVVFCISLYMVFNWMRFGNVFDSGYSYLHLKYFMRERVEKYGLFNLAYVPFNFLYMFLQGFHLEFSSSSYLGGVKMDPFGTSLTFASPFIFFAFLARGEKRILWAAWISISMIILPMLFYYNNGWVQPHTQRFSLDFFPILILLVALGTKQASEKLWKAIILYAVILNLLVLFSLSLLYNTRLTNIF